MVELESKTVIVTGASQGLGKCIVENILNKYTTAQVVLVARNSELLTSFYNSLNEDKQRRSLIVVGDVTESLTIEKTIKNTLQKFGKIDSVIFNAGIIEPVGHLNEPNYDIESMKKLFDVNYFSIVQFINQLLTTVPSKSPISLIFVSSGASTRGIDGWLAYGSSKAAVNQLCKQLHDEMSPRVKCISVAPGVVDTAMQKTIREKFGDKMTASSHQRFLQLHSDKKLLDGMVVGEVYAKLAVEAIPDTLSGEYVRWDSVF